MQSFWRENKAYHKRCANGESKQDEWENKKSRTKKQEKRLIQVHFVLGIAGITEFFEQRGS